MPTYFSPEIFASYLRYLVQAAQNKRVVPYHELENVFGLGHNMVGYYAGQVGDFCNHHDWPLLNALVISATTCMPSDGFDSYLRGRQTTWGDCLAECWREFHLTTSRAHQVRNFSGLTSMAREWASSGASNGPTYLANR